MQVQIPKRAYDRQARQDVIIHFIIIVAFFTAWQGAPCAMAQYHHTLNVTRATMNTSGLDGLRVGHSLSLCIQLEIVNSQTQQPVATGCKDEVLELRVKLYSASNHGQSAPQIFAASMQNSSRSASLSLPAGSRVCSDAIECAFRVRNSVCLDVYPYQVGLSAYASVNIEQTSACMDPVAISAVEPPIVPLNLTCGPSADNFTVCEDASVASVAHAGENNCAPASLYSSSLIWHSYDTSGYTGSDTGMRVHVPGVNRQKNTLLLAVQGRIQANDLDSGTMWSIQTNLSTDVLSLNSILNHYAWNMQQIWLFAVLQTPPNTPFSAEVKFGSEKTGVEKPCLFPQDTVVSKSRNLMALALPSGVGVFSSRNVTTQSLSSAAADTWHEVLSVGFDVPMQGNWTVLLFAVVSRFQSDGSANVNVAMGFLLDGTVLPFRAAGQSWQGQLAKPMGGMTTFPVTGGNHVAKFAVRVPTNPFQLTLPHDTNGHQQRDMAAIVVSSSSLVSRKWAIPCTSANAYLCRQLATSSPQPLVIDGNEVAANITLSQTSDIAIFLFIGRVQAITASSPVHFSITLDNVTVQDYVQSTGETTSTDFRPLKMQVLASDVPAGRHVIKAMQRSASGWYNLDQAGGASNIELTAFVPAAADQQIINGHPPAIMLD